MLFYSHVFQKIKKVANKHDEINPFLGYLFQDSEMSVD